MYPIDPPAVYAHESVMADPRYRRRVEGVLAALPRVMTPIVYKDEELPTLIRDHGLFTNRRTMGTMADVRDPILLFNTFRFDGDFEARRQRLEALGYDPKWGHQRDLFGAAAFHWANYNLDGDPARKDKVCRPCWRIHLQQGCLHRCKYCGLGGLLISMVNVEEYCQHLGRLIERHPWQLTYLLDDDADPPCLEPEQGVLGPLIEYFGTLKDRYLIIHTKTWNTEWLRGLKHNGNTILVWSISGATQSGLIEPRTGTTEQRVEAARVAQEAGYQIRYKFKPIIPVQGWRDDATEAVRLVFEKTRPDVISLCCFMWMDVDDMKRRLPLELLDAECLQAAEAAREEVAETRAKPFPPRTRAMIYRHYLDEIRKRAPDIPVSLSTENFAMWRRMAKELGTKPTRYVCGCGPQSVPGATTLTCHPFKIAVRNDNGEIPGTY
ncbi:MAG: hypothetical protein A3K19_00635 [Lentisphaerae bacterium RIFOXYB12_FULL_65_16]|nr:MAG: hypothetical protein A3K18_14875 [Lentisphaerae bacterium RIFOXYA12_64_32]OGV86796.1 MAG: hypothetical protein A3K19_00635 [Lentisphaerae bacterium RIFOXYB12_FULL_65_16]